MAEPEWCCNVMVEAPNPHGVHPMTSMSYVYKVVQHLDMLWMGTWVPPSHPYTVTPVQVGIDFKKIGVWLSPIDVVISWLRLQLPIECTSHFHIKFMCMYAKYFSTLLSSFKTASHIHVMYTNDFSILLISCVWAWYAYGCTPMLIYLCRCMWNFWKEIGGKAGPEWYCGDIWGYKRLALDSCIL